MEKLFFSSAVFSSWQVLCLGGYRVVPEQPNQFPVIWGWQFGFSLRPLQSGDTSVNLLRTVIWTDDLVICSCLEMASRDLCNLCKSKLLILRSSLCSLDLPIVLSIGQSSDYSQTNPFYAGEEKIPVVVSRDQLNKVLSLLCPCPCFGFVKPLATLKRF